jgi:hypothetical protein
MKIKLIFIILLFCNCSRNKVSGYVYDFDTNIPIKNVVVKINESATQTDSSGYFNIEVNSISNCTINLKKEGYANKKVFRKPDPPKDSDANKIKNTIIYMFNNESDFSNKNK